MTRVPRFLASLLPSFEVVNKMHILPGDVLTPVQAI